jgi:septum site-determining protein MinD
MLAIDDVTNILALPLIGVIPDDENVVSSTNMGEPVIRKKNTKSGEAVTNIVRRVLGEDVPYMILAPENRIMAMFKRWFK